MRSIPRSAGLISLFTRHRNAANLVMVLMILFGTFALGRINTQFFPTTEIPVVTVAVSWPGASAEDVEANILEVLEPELRYLDGVDRVTSRAREGVASIGLEYEQGEDMKEAQREVESAVSAVTNLPEDAEQPTIRQAAFFDRVARIAVTGPFSEGALRFYAKKVRDDLIERGIDKVVFTGMRDRELQVDVPEYELRRLGLTIGDVSERIQQNSRDLPSGQMEGSVERQLRTLADISTAEALGEVEVRAFESGEKVRLGEIANVAEGFEDGQPQGFLEGKRAIQLEIQRAATADTLATSAILTDYLNEVEGQLPAGLEIVQYDVRADALTDRIMLLVTNGLGGLALVIAVLFIFLNARIAFWVAAGIPVALLATIGIMWVLGQSINMLSLFGLIMMLGVIVDDAIVVGEHTATRFADGDGPYEAAEEGAGRMVIPVSAAMITTISTFGPILVISGVLGQIIGVLPIVVIAVIVASLVECFLILPGHLAHTLHPRATRRWSFWRQFAVALIVGVFVISISGPNAGGWFVLMTQSITGIVGSYVPLPNLGLDLEAGLDWLQALRSSTGPMIFLAGLAVVAYAASVAVEAVFAFFATRARRRNPDGDPMQDGRFRRTFDRGFTAFRDGPFDAVVRFAYRLRYVTMALAFASVIIGVWGVVASGKVGFVFFPSAEAENINARIVFNAGVSETRSIAVLREVEMALRRAETELGEGEPLVVAAFSTLGRAGRSTADNVASIRVQLTTSEARTIRTPAIVKEWRAQVPKMAGVSRVALFESRGGPPGRDIEIQLQGPDVAVLKQAAADMIPLVETINGASGVSDDLPYGKPEFAMELTPRGSALGFTIESVGRQLRDSFEGAIPRRFADGDDEITVRVAKVMRASGAAALRELELRSPAGEFVPLSDIVAITERQGFASIERIDGRATVSVTADINTDINTTENAIATLEASGLADITSRYGIQYRYSGKDEERREAFADLTIGVVLAMSINFIVLAWVFASYWRPLAVMLIIPFGIVGAVLGHLAMGMPLTILSVIGLLGLSGILVNDSIILVSRFEQRRQMGEAVDEAIIGASRDRLRAVLLTSLTTIGGLVPLLFETSLQAQFLLPMAVTMVFGLASATVLVLFLVPVFMGIGYDINAAFRTLFGSPKLPTSTSARSDATTSPAQ
jgi:multidrug efflux pump subunit AcrB